MGEEYVPAEMLRHRNQIIIFVRTAFRNYLNRTACKTHKHLKETDETEIVGNRCARNAQKKHAKFENLRNVKS